MFKKTIISAAATLAIAAGALGATAGGASAQGVMHGPGMPTHYNHRERVCRPVFRNVKVYRHHHWIWTKVKVGERCTWRRW